MSPLARLAAAVAAAVLPVLSLAQEAGGRDAAAPRAGYSWLWIVVGALVVVALFRLLVSRNRTNRPNPPGRPL
ncbi:MAG TPA: hypothetical protein VFL83_02615 [Anaeromyxobacter sp.]|nr:hypothetical protein [Anaeromyxobacter sp.]